VVEGKLRRLFSFFDVVHLMIHFPSFVESGKEDVQHVPAVPM
jgi:hypothetical protein